MANNTGRPAKTPAAPVKTEINGAAFDKAIRNAPQPGYLLYGDEDYLKNHALAAAHDVLCADPSFEPFNFMRFDSMTYTPEGLLRALQPLPMMADRKLITVTGLCPATMKADDLDALCEVLAMTAEYDYNVLLLSVPAKGMECDAYAKTKALYARLASLLVPVKYDFVSPDRLASWILRHFDHGGVTADAAVPRLLTERCGQDMYRLSFEIDKLCAYVQWNGRTRVTPEDVSFVTSETLSFGAFALSNALLERRTDVALRIVEEKKREREEPVAILSEISRIFGELLRVKTLSSSSPEDKTVAAAAGISPQKLNIYRRALRNATVERLKTVMDACFETDAVIKQSYNDFGPLEALICRL